MVRVHVRPQIRFRISDVRYLKSDIRNLNYRGVEQLAARQAHNLEVVGSNPTPATNLVYKVRKFIKSKGVR